MNKTYKTLRLINSGTTPQYELVATQTLLNGNPAGLKIVIQEIEVCKECQHWTYHNVFTTDIIGMKDVIDSNWGFKYLEMWVEENGTTNC